MMTEYGICGDMTVKGTVISSTSTGNDGSNVILLNQNKVIGPTLFKTVVCGSEKRNKYVNGNMCGWTFRWYAFDDFEQYISNRYDRGDTSVNGTQYIYSDSNGVHRRTFDDGQWEDRVMTAPRIYPDDYCVGAEDTIMDLSEGYGAVKDGMTVRSGTYQPDDSEGKNGDIYIQLES